MKQIHVLFLYGKKEMIKDMKKLKNGKAGGIDGMVEILKQTQTKQHIVWKKYSEVI